jgi:hypothetical protein
VFNIIFLSNAHQSIVSPVFRLSIIAECHFVGYEAFETGSDHTNRKIDHGFLLMFHTCFGSVVNRSQVICDFSTVKHGGLSLSAARGHARPKVTSPLDSSTTVFFSCSIHISCFNKLRFKVILVFLIVDYGGMSISSAKRRLRPEVTSPVDGATMVSYSCFSSDTSRPSSTVSTL